MLTLKVPTHCHRTKKFINTSLCHFERTRSLNKLRDLMKGNYSFILLILILAASGTAKSQQVQEHRPDRPRILPIKHYGKCYNGAGFIQIDKERLDNRLPPGFTSRDGSILGEGYEGYGLLALLYYSCPVADSVYKNFALIATPIEDPALAAELREVRWNWYEFARIVESSDLLQELSSIGFTIRKGTLSHSPFHEGDTLSDFTVEVPGGVAFTVQAALTDPITFQSQSHRFWHRSAKYTLLSTRLDFDNHHSWIGGFANCRLNADLLGVKNLAEIQCNTVGVTEAIESLTFDEQIVQWN